MSAVVYPHAKLAGCSFTVNETAPGAAPTALVELTTQGRVTNVNEGPPEPETVQLTMTAADLARVVHTLQQLAATIDELQ